MTNARTALMLWFGIAPPDDFGHRIPFEIGAKAAFGPLTSLPQIKGGRPLQTLRLFLLYWGSARLGLVRASNSLRCPLSCPLLLTT